ncbi:MAG: preprotein translocase subunit SecG [Treponema sp.]|nr:preprotein translocase subunit SecG [Treponema sp.]
MGAIRVILLVAFVIICVLSVLIIIIQDDGQSGMGGLLGGRGTAVFGSHSASILTKTTFVFVVLFFACALSLALLNKKPRLQQNLAPTETVQESAESSQETDNSWWQQEDASEETSQESSAQEVTE